MRVRPFNYNKIHFNLKYLSVITFLFILELSEMIVMQDPPQTPRLQAIQVPPQLNKHIGLEM